MSLQTSGTGVASRSYWPLVPAISGLTMVVTTVGFLAPILVLLSREFEVSVAHAGQLVVLTAIPWAVVAPLSGALSDRFGRRPVIITALTGMGLATLAGAFATEFWMLAALRVVTGCFGSGGPPTIMAGLVDHYPPHQRGKVIGWSNTCFSLANLTAVPILGAAGGAWGWRAAFLIIGAGLLLGALFIWLAYPRAAPGSRNEGNPIRAYRHLFGRPHLGTFLLSNLFERLTFMVFSLYLASYLIQTYNRDPVTVAPLLFLTALGTFTGAIGGGLLADRLDRVKLAAWTLALSGLCGLATFAWPAWLVFSVAAGFGFGLTNAASRPPFMSLLLGLSDQHRGALNGLVAMSNQIGWAIGAGIGGLILGLAGYPGLGQFLFVFGLLSAALVVVARSVAYRPAIEAAPPQPRSPLVSSGSGDSSRDL
ncbi:MAG TPA: MFS transporter [Dehalococcoidia bacterium]|nr:MFS transporter [Dehalococcoidia bacterium]